MRILNPGLLLQGTDTDFLLEKSSVSSEKIFWFNILNFI